MKQRHSKRIEWLKANVQHDDPSCLQWPFGRNSKGYGAVTFGGKQMVASRFMCELAHGEAPSDAHQAAHSCGNGHLGCINPRHIRWATVSENQMDSVAHGTHEGLKHKGEGHPLAKLDDVTVLAIRASARSGNAQARICERYGLSSSAVSRIINRKSWKHI